MKLLHFHLYPQAKNSRLNSAHGSDADEFQEVESGGGKKVHFDQMKPADRIAKVARELKKLLRRQSSHTSYTCT